MAQRFLQAETITEPGTIGNEAGVEQEDKKRFRVSLAAGAGFVLIVLAALFVLTRQTRAPGAGAVERLPFGQEEQAYAARIHFLGLQMSRAANMLNQEVTYITGQVSNDGVRTIREVEVTLEFRDQFNQVVLRETRPLLGARARPLGGGERRGFQVSLEYVPEAWNQQYPSIQVTGLQLE